MPLLAFVGAQATVAGGLRRFVDATKPDELIAVSHIYDHGARVRSLELLAAAGTVLR